MKIKFLWLILLLSFNAIAQNKKEFPLNDFNVYFLYAKINQVNFKTCDEGIIGKFNSEFGKHNPVNEFERNRQIMKMRDSLEVIKNRYDTSELYWFTAVRLFDEYSFKDSAFFLKSSSELNHYETKKSFNGNSLNIEYTNGKQIQSLYIELPPDKAEALIKYKDQSGGAMKARTIYGDNLGNQSDKDRQTFLKYYLQFKNLPDQNVKEDAPKILYADIVKVSFFADKALTIKLSEIIL
jgi:hypothetical protein